MRKETRYFINPIDAPTIKQYIAENQPPNTEYQLSRIDMEKLYNEAGKLMRDLAVVLGKIEATSQRKSPAGYLTIGKIWVMIQELSKEKAMFTINDLKALPQLSKYHETTLNSYLLRLERWKKLQRCTNPTGGRYICYQINPNPPMEVKPTVQ